MCLNFELNVVLVSDGLTCGPVGVVVWILCALEFVLVEVALCDIEVFLEFELEVSTMSFSPAVVSSVS